MKSSTWKKIKSAVGILSLLVLLSGCSSENVIRLLSADNKKDMKDDNNSMQAICMEDDTKKYQIGESFKVISPIQENQNNIGYICTVEGVNYYSTVLDERVDPKKLLDSTEYYTDEEPQIIEKEDYKKYGIVICTMKIRNINMPEDYNITECAFVSVNKDKNVQLISMPVYFDAQGKSEEDGKEYHCRLPVGEEHEMAVGWLINLDQYSIDSLYIQVPYGADDEWVNYVQLSL